MKCLRESCCWYGPRLTLLIHKVFQQCFWLKSFTKIVRVFLTAVRINGLSNCRWGLWVKRSFFLFANIDLFDDTMLQVPTTKKNTTVFFSSFSKNTRKNEYFLSHYRKNNGFFFCRSHLHHRMIVTIHLCKYSPAECNNPFSQI